MKTVTALGGWGETYHHGAKIDTHKTHTSHYHGIYDRQDADANEAVDFVSVVKAILKPGGNQVNDV